MMMTIFRFLSNVSSIDYGSLHVETIGKTCGQTKTTDLDITTQLRLGRQGWDRTVPQMDLLRQTKSKTDGLERPQDEWIEGFPKR